MKELTINGKDYKLEYSFEAAERKDFVGLMFRIVSGAALLDEAEDMENPTAKDMINGTVGMVADIPHICRIGFFVGLLENNSVSEDEAKALMRTYMKETGIGYADLYEELRKCMEDDGFFDLSGITKMLKTMQENQKQAKVPAGHKKKLTGTK